jgi:hypothetical protein
VSFFLQNAASYSGETNVVAKVIDRLALAKPKLRFPSIPGDYSLGLFKTQLTMSVRSEVIPLGVKLKVAVLSIHVRTSEKKHYLARH